MSHTLASCRAGNTSCLSLLKPAGQLFLCFCFPASTHMLACGLATHTWNKLVIHGLPSLRVRLATCSICAGMGFCYSKLTPQSCGSAICQHAVQECTKHELLTKSRLCLESPGCVLRRESPATNRVFHHASWLSCAATFLPTLQQGCAVNLMAVLCGMQLRLYRVLVFFQFLELKVSISLLWVTLARNLSVSLWTVLRQPLGLPTCPWRQ